MYISDYIKRDRINGKGVRVSIYVSGCLHNCKGCFSYETWNFKNGELFDEKYYQRLLTDLKSPQTKGRLSILGGDAMFSPRETYYLLARLRKEIPHLNVWLWTGFTMEEINNEFMYPREMDTDNNIWRQKVIEEIDVLIDGKFDSDLYAPDIPFRGSSNQRIIEHPQSSLLATPVQE